MNTWRLLGSFVFALLLVGSIVTLGWALFTENVSLPDFVWSRVVEPRSIIPLTIIILLATYNAYLGPSNPKDGDRQ